MKDEMGKTNMILRETAAKDIAVNSVKLHRLLDSFSLAAGCGAAIYFGKSYLFYETGFEDDYLAGHMGLLLELFRKCDRLPDNTDDYILDRTSGLAARAIAYRSGSSNTLMGYLLIRLNPNSDLSHEPGERQHAVCSLMYPLCTFIISEGYLSLFYQRQVSTFHQFVWDHTNDDWRVATLCEIFGTSKTKLYDNFLTYTGMTIGDYIRSVRLEKAKYLLATSDLSVTEISTEVGFHDYNYFLRVFKKTFGRSAGSYRKQACSSRK